MDYTDAATFKAMLQLMHTGELTVAQLKDCKLLCALLRLCVRLALLPDVTARVSDALLVSLKGPDQAIAFIQELLRGGGLAVPSVFDAAVALAARIFECSSVSLTGGGNALPAEVLDFIIQNASRLPPSSNGLSFLTEVKRWVASLSAPSTSDGENSSQAAAGEAYQAASGAEFSSNSNSSSEPAAKRARLSASGAEAGSSTGVDDDEVQIVEPSSSSSSGSGAGASDLASRLRQMQHPMMHFAPHLRFGGVDLSDAIKLLTGVVPPSFLGNLVSSIVSKQPVGGVSEENLLSYGTRREMLLAGPQLMSLTCSHGTSTLTADYAQAALRRITYVRAMPSRCNAGNCSGARSIDLAWGSVSDKEPLEEADVLFRVNRLDHGPFELGVQVYPELSSQAKWTEKLRVSLAGAVSSGATSGDAGSPAITFDCSPRWRCLLVCGAGPPARQLHVLEAKLVTITSCTRATIRRLYCHMHR